MNFDPTDLAWLERGGVLAIAHVRGGGERGKQWHLAGQKLTKPNTWKDFIACAEYLIDKKYTSPEKLAGQGGSAGGIPIGRAITERPDLFAAALINVGSLDTLRFETTMNGPPNVPEFGTVKTEDGLPRACCAMSAYHHVKDGDEIPGRDAHARRQRPARRPVDEREDDRPRSRRPRPAASPSSSASTTSPATASARPATQQEQLSADQWAFLLWQMGDAGVPAEVIA